MVVEKFMKNHEKVQIYVQGGGFIEILFSERWTLEIDSINPVVHYGKTYG